MREVVLIDGAHLYMEAPKFLGGAHHRADRGKLLDALLDHLEAQGVSPWRSYWIDAPPSPDRSHEVESLAFRENVHVILGTRNIAGIQKGVDARAIRLLLEIADWQVDTAVHIVAGDDDYIPAMEVATSKGIHLTLWHVEGSSSITPRQQWAVDRCRPIPAWTLAEAFTVAEVRASQEVLWQAALEVGRAVRQQTRPEVIAEWRLDLNYPNWIPREHFSDTALSVGARVGVGYYTFEPHEYSAIHRGFWAGIDGTA